jgi:hypothetical protein
MRMAKMLGIVSRSIAFRAATILLVASGIYQGRPAAASIVYYDLADVLIASQCNASHQLDMNGDSVDDFEIRSFFLPGLGGLDSEWLVTTPYGASRVLGESRVSLLPSGFIIDGNVSPPPDWLAGADLPIFIGSPSTPPCDPDFVGTTGFLGLEFDITGNTHYGWARLTVHTEFGIGVLHDYAYESDPGVGIIAGAIPEPSTVLLLSLGGIGLLWRARRRR